MIFGTFRCGNQYFEKVTPETETSDRDLSFGSDQASWELQICDKKWDGVWKTTFPTAGDIFLAGNRDFDEFSLPNCRSRPGVQLGRVKTSKKRFPDQKISKIVELTRKFHCNYKDHCCLVPTKHTPNTAHVWSPTRENIRRLIRGHKVCVMVWDNYS